MSTRCHRLSKKKTELLASAAIAKKRALYKHKAGSSASAVPPDYSTEPINTFELEVESNATNPEMSQSVRSAPIRYMYGNGFPFLENFARQFDFKFLAPADIASIYVAARMTPRTWKTNYAIAHGREIDAQLAAGIDAYFRSAGHVSTNEMHELCDMFAAFMIPSQEEYDQHTDATHSFIDAAFDHTTTVAHVPSSNSNNRMYRIAMFLYNAASLPDEQIAAMLTDAAVVHSGASKTLVQPIVELVQSCKPEPETLQMTMRSFTARPKTRK